jgi:FtsP/CotA-like multicopper oxidase with cupredoxin domain
LLRFKEGVPVTIDIYNRTDTPEQLHWHGQKVPTEVDGASEEGTPFIPAQGKRRITFTPRPALAQPITALDHAKENNSELWKLRSFTHGSEPWQARYEPLVTRSFFA